jgi:tetratricopeptide (TPR) repeat protein
VVLFLAGSLAGAAAPPPRPPMWLRLLTGADERRAAALDAEIRKHWLAGRFDDALNAAKVLAALRQRHQGADHYQAVSARWAVVAWQRVVKADKKSQTDYQNFPSQLVLAEHSFRQGKHHQAQALLEKALAVAGKVLGEEHPATANTYDLMALNLRAEGKYDQAELLYRKVLAIRRKLLGEEHPATANTYNYLGYTLHAQGKYDLAEPLFHKALAIRRKVVGEEHHDTAASYNNLAYNFHAQGKYDQAEPLHHKALAIRRKLLGEEHRATAQSYNNLAVNLRDQGKYDKAEPLLVKALAIHRKALGEEHRDTATSYSNLAINLQAQGNYDEAEPLHFKALVIHRKALGEQHSDTATSYYCLAGNLQDQGKCDKAEPLFRKALAIRRKALGEQHHDTANSYYSLAANLQAQGKCDKAEPLFRKALAIYRKVLGDEHPHTANSYHKLAYNLMAQGKYDQAEHQAVRAVQAFDRARWHFATTGIDRAAETTRLSPYGLLTTLLARKGSHDLAWQRFEHSLARGSGDELARRLRWPQADRDRLGSLRFRLHRLDQLIEQTLLSQGDAAGHKKRREDLLGQRLRLAQEIQDFGTALEKRHGVAAGQVFSRASLQKALPADAAFVGWVDVDKEHWGVLLKATGEPVWVALPGTGEKKTWTDKDNNLPARLRQAVISGKGDWKPLAKQLYLQRLGPLAGHLKGIRRLIFLPAPAMDGLPLETLIEGYTISYAASGTFFAHLQSLPPTKNKRLLALADPVFATRKAANQNLPPRGLLITFVLPQGNAARRGLKVDDVLLDYAGVVLKDVAHLGQLLQAHAGKEAVAVQFWRDGTISTRDLKPGPLGIALDKRSARQALAERYRIDKLVASTRSGEAGTWADLPGTRVEVEGLRTLAGDQRATVLTDSQASQQKLAELAGAGALAKYRFLHLATHGSTDARVPLQSALILSRDQLPDPMKQLESGKPVYTGRLTAAEVLASWKLDAELVTLSACQSGLGKHEHGEGFVGFAQAFILAGSRSVLLSLWKVDDGATALLMQRFYANLLGKREGLKKPLAKAEALAEAKAWLRGLSREEALKRWAGAQGGVARGKRKKLPLLPAVPKSGDKADRPYAHPYYWAAFILVGRPD